MKCNAIKTSKSRCKAMPPKTSSLRLHLLPSLSRTQIQSQSAFITEATQIKRDHQIRMYRVKEVAVTHQSSTITQFTIKEARQPTQPVLVAKSHHRTPLPEVMGEEPGETTMAMLFQCNNRPLQATGTWAKVMATAVGRSTTPSTTHSSLLIPHSNTRKTSNKLA